MMVQASLTLNTPDDRVVLKRRLKVCVMKCFLVLTAILSLLCIQNAWAVLGADDAMRLLQGLEQQKALRNINKDYADSELVRPSKAERAAIDNVLKQKPQSDALDPVDVKFLKAIRSEPVWTYKQQSIVHMIIKEVNGIDLSEEESEEPSK